jgi:hypothetical protein
MYSSFSFSLSSLMWILWSRCEASAWNNDKRKRTITCRTTIWNGSGVLQNPKWEWFIAGFSHIHSCYQYLWMWNLTIVDSIFITNYYMNNINVVFQHDSTIVDFGRRRLERRSASLSQAMVSVDSHSVKNKRYPLVI